MSMLEQRPIFSVRSELILLTMSVPHHVTDTIMGVTYALKNFVQVSCVKNLTQVCTISCSRKLEKQTWMTINMIDDASLEHCQ